MLIYFSGMNRDEDYPSLSNRKLIVIHVLHEHKWQRILSICTVNMP